MGSVGESNTNLINKDGGAQHVLLLEIELLKVRDTSPRIGGSEHSTWMLIKKEHRNKRC